MNKFYMTNRIILFARKYLNSWDKNICNWGETLQLLTVEAQTKVAVARVTSAIGVTKSQTFKLLIQGYSADNHFFKMYIHAFKTLKYVFKSEVTSSMIEAKFSSYGQTIQ